MFYSYLKRVLGNVFQLSETSNNSYDISFMYNCHDVTVILLNVALNTINLIFYLQRHIPAYLYIYIFMRIIDFIQFFASYFPILMSFKCPQSSLFYIRVITKLPNSEQSYKGKVKTHNYTNRQNQSTTGKLWKP